MNENLIFWKHRYYCKSFGFFIFLYLNYESRFIGFKIFIIVIESLIIYHFKARHLPIKANSVLYNRLPPISEFVNTNFL